MQTQWYPELKADELPDVIGPLADAHLPFPLPARPSIGCSAESKDRFGFGAENHSFQRVSQAVAAEALKHGWNAALDEHLEDPVVFAAALRDVLAGDFLSFAIRPLADAMVALPEPADEAAHRHGYQTFCVNLLADGFADFAARFPVTWQRAKLRLQRRVAAAVETLNHVVDDAADLHLALGLDAGAKVRGLSESGDTHSGGRAVSILELSDGTKVVHKPRSVDGEARYAELCAVLRDRHGARLTAAPVLTRAGYGYMGFVDVCSAGPDLRETGALAALLYALNARDMHFSNIISTKGGVAPVDLETVLHLHRQKSRGTVETPESGYRIIESSVYGTGVLPLVITREGRDGYADVGFLGGGEVQGAGPFRAFRILRPFRDDLSVVWDDGPVPESVRRETIDPTTAAVVRASSDEMVAGFRTAYRALAADRRWFVATVRLIFAGAELRYIHNPTVLYDQCLRLLTGTEAGADVVLARGLARRIGIAGRDSDPKLLRSECEQIWATDVPYFLVTADRVEITDGSADRVVVANVSDSPLDEFEAKMGGMGESDLARQVGLIRIAFNAKLPDRRVMLPASEVLGAVGPRPGAGEFRDLAAALGRDLLAEQVDDRFAHLPRTWIGPVASADAAQPWPPGVLDYDLYTGRVGPALALAALGRVLDDEDMASGAAAVFGPMSAILATRSYELRSIAQAGLGAFNGFSGTLWALAAAGRLLENDEHVRTAAAARGLLLDPNPTADRSWFDLISGGAGTHLVCLSLGGGEQIVREVEIACDRALAADLPGQLSGAGLAHGLSSLVLYGSRAWGELGVRRGRDLAEAAFAALARTPSGVWPDAGSGSAASSDSWCNGTAGMLVATEAAVTHGLADPARLSDLLRRTASTKLSTVLTLCHGVLGLRDVAARLAPSVDEAARVLDGLDRHLSAGELRAGLADRGSRYNQSHSLMVGRAGVAWHLASRLARERPPSPLFLAPVVAPLTATMA